MTVGDSDERSIGQSNQLGLHAWCCKVATKAHEVKAAVDVICI